MSVGKPLVHLVSALAIIGLGCLLESYSQEARILVPPNPVNISLNEATVFNCTATASFIFWCVNGKCTSDFIRSIGFDDSALAVTLNATENLRARALRVQGSQVNNESKVACEIYLQTTATKFDYNISGSALMLVQGLLESVSNLTVTLINATTVLISWSPPFTLDGVPILGYNVTITCNINTTSGENETMLVEDTTLLYSIDHLDPKNNLITVTVVPINKVGAGQPAHYVTNIIQPVSSPMLSTLPDVESTNMSISMTVRDVAQTNVTATTHQAVSVMNDTNATTLLQTTHVVIIVLSPFMCTIIVAILLILIMLLVCGIRRHRKTKANVQDVIITTDNPVYAVVLKQTQKIELCENTRAIDTASSATEPLMITTDSRAPVSLSAVVAVSVVTMVTMITTIVITLSCCLLKKHKTNKAAKPLTSDVVLPFSSNPAYGEITTRSIKMKENTAYATVQPAVLPQYENVVMKENNVFAVALTPATSNPVAPQFVMKENSAYAIPQSAAVSPKHKDIVMKENIAYSTTTTTTTSTTTTTTTARFPQYENIARISAKRASDMYSKHNYDNVEM